MPTGRDRVWNAARTLAERRGSFTAQHVADAIGEDAPTRRTIANCLDAMEELDVLESEGGGGRSPRVFFLPSPDTSGGYSSSSPPPSNQVSVFPYPGGKGRRSEWLLEKMPAHDTYIEVFGGSGALLYNKAPSKNEIYNDINGDLVQFFETLRDRPDELAEWVATVPYAREVFEEWADAYYSGERPEDPVERAGRFFTLRYMQFGGKIEEKSGFKARAKRSPARTFNNARQRLEKVAGRFQDVIIEHKDFRELIPDYDDPDVDVLFYCDPPYVGTEGRYNSEFDHEAFVQTLEAVDGDWMVSYEELPEGLEEYHVIQRDRRYRMTKESKETTERLVCNFDPEKRTKFVADGVTQETLAAVTD